MIARLVDGLTDRRRLWIAAALLLTAVGVAAWFTMPRQEDPRLPERFGTLIVPFPGADALTVERLVVRPLEDELAEVSEIVEVRATARTDVAIVRVELDESVYDVTTAWDEVEHAVEQAEPDLPDEAGPWELAHDFNDAEAVIVMVHGSADPLALETAADRVEDRLLRVPGASRVKRAGDPGRQITVRLDPTVARQVGLSPAALSRQLSASNATIPGGAVRVDGRTVVVRPRTEQRSLAELGRSPVLLPSGAAVPLSELATLSEDPAHPPQELVLHQGQRAIALSVVPEPDLDLVAFGERARTALDDVRGSLEPIELTVFADQPQQVQERLSDLGFSLLLGIGIVAGVLFVAMGARLGLVVASVVPLVTFSTVALYAMAGGVLQQLSIAALVIALGLLVDNAIVVAEAVQARLDAGESNWDAARGAITELAVPLATATGTTLASFVPMLLSPGTTADFTRAIPIVIMVALTISYLFAVLVTPILGAWFLRPRAQTGPSRLDRLGQALSRWTTRRPAWVLAGVGLLVAGTGTMGLFVQSEFFPYADRARFVATVQLPEGSDLHETARVASQVADWAREQEHVVGVDTVVGRAAPRFYYNIPQSPRAPHLASVVITTDGDGAVPELVTATRLFGESDVPEARVVSRRLQQGPPVESPVELRLIGEDLDDLGQAADTLVLALRQVPGAVSATHDLGVGVPTLQVDIDDARALRRRTTRTDVALALLGQTRGLEASPYRAGDEPVPLRIRGPEGLDTRPLDLVATDVPGAAGPLPLEALARTHLAWTPSAIRHIDRERVVTVMTELDEGATFSSVIAGLQPTLDALELPEGVRLEIGGEAEESGEANSALLGALPLGALLLLACLLLEFNSFRRVGIVLVTVPLAAAGVLPGLVLGGQPFGFMSLLGVIALVGIVVNNAIVLLDVVDRGLGEGLDVADAVQAAVTERVRPILLTTGTTVAGLLPLALSGSSLWPPLASAMISGLLASTLLTLLVVPALSRLLLTPKRTA